MIVSAAVRIYDKKQCMEIILPVHRHCDAFYILRALGYDKNDFKSNQNDQGFLDENGLFYNRVDAKLHALMCKQIKHTEHAALFSEDLW